LEITVDAKEEYLLKFEDFPNLLKTLLKEGIVDKIIGGETKRNRFSVSPTTIEKAEDIDEFPLSNLIVYGYSRTDSAAKYLHSSLKGAKDERIALIARPCDTRALVELAKIRQVNLDNLFIIAIEDRGMVMDVSKAMRKNDEIDEEKIVKEKAGDEGLIFEFEDGSTKTIEYGKKIDFAENCLRCIRKGPVRADLSISDIGLPIDSKDLILKTYSDKGETVLEKSGLKLKSLPDDIKKAHTSKFEEIIEKAKEKREKDLEEWKNVPQEEKIEMLKKCTQCGLCVRGCPVCYCVDCILQKKRKENKINAEAYQLTRIAHVADRCVECGNCDNNCPMNLPLSLYFQSLNEAFKEKFEYTPGESTEDVPFRSGKAISEMELEKT
jgi:formate dehydrogenase (coenzyme F420) beta subunit